jgi:hypothetical protein
MSARGGKKKGSKKTPAWHCNWCHTSKASWQAPGPDGPKTLCGKCNYRWGQGETGPRSADWKCGWCSADDSETRKRYPGPKGPATICETCHGRHIMGATGPPAKNWRCDWCGTKEPGRARHKGPKGPGTLCDLCGGRFSNGATGPLSATFECRWCNATSTHRRCPGPTGKEEELCNSCGIAYAKASDKIKARLVHVEKELVRLTSVPVFDVDAGTETRAPPPKRARDDIDAAPGGGLKALKAATDVTAGALVEIKREKEELEDRLLCTICMEADAPRTWSSGRATTSSPAPRAPTRSRSARIAARRSRRASLSRTRARRGCVRITAGRITTRRP